MLVYLIAYFSILIFVFFQKSLTIKQKRIFLAFWIVYISLICGLKDMLGGYDCYIYSEVFDACSDDIDKGVSIIDNAAIIMNPTELGFGLFNIIIGYITANRYIFLLLSTFITFYLFYLSFSHYTKYPFLAFFIFFCIFYFFTFTYTRQVMAVGITWLSIPYAIKRKPIPFFLIVLLAVSFHNSAALFALLYFIANKRFSKKEILIFLSLSLLLGLTPIGNLLFSILGGAMNESKAQSSLSHADTANYMYLLEALFFFILIYIKYEDIPKKKLTTCMLNISLLFIFVLTFFIKFSDGGRMSWYFLIGIATTMAHIGMKGANSTYIKIIIIITVSLLYFRLLLGGWSGILTPYKSFLSDGPSSDLQTWSKYEYDHNYNRDKFYRTPLKIFK